MFEDDVSHYVEETGIYGSDLYRDAQNTGELSTQLVMFRIAIGLSETSEFIHKFILKIMLDFYKLKQCVCFLAQIKILISISVPI